MFSKNLPFRHPLPPKLPPPVVIIEFHDLRILIGLVGFFLPTALILGNYWWGDGTVHTSISDYYYAGHFRDLFVGALCAIGTFLVCYRGYAGKTVFSSEHWRGLVAGPCAIGVALFPHDTFGYIHYPCAIVLFFILGTFAFFQFAHTRSGPRRFFYRLCGVLIFGSMATLALDFMPGHGPFERWPRLFTVLESVVVWSFGAAWLVKGW